MEPFRIVVHPVCLNRQQAAAALGMSLDSFERYAQHDLRCIRKGRMRLYPVRELERWAEKNAEPLPRKRTLSRERTVS